MNIKIITRHGPSNYGSLLQSIATLKILKDLGHNPQIVDYQREEERGLKMVLAQLKRKERYKNPFKKVVYVIVRYPIEKYAQCRFDKMRESYLNMTDRYRTIDEMSDLDADVFMTGSDQVWGEMVDGSCDLAYFLQFITSDKVRKVAYAASFGQQSFNEDRRSLYKAALKSYYKISVREDSAKRFIESCGIVDCVEQVLDPTLLLNGDEWIKMLPVSKLQKQIVNTNYVLVYQIHNDSTLSEYAIKLARYVCMPLYRVNPYAHQIFRGGKFYNCPDVSDFLTLIRNASFIVTDSFHGTCFSIIFNKQFMEVLPNNTTQTRNQSLLTLTGLTSRIVSTPSDVILANKKIDYEKVNDVLSSERERSINVMRWLLV